MPQDLMLYAYKAALHMQPIALLDYYVKIVMYTKTNIWRKVIFFEAIPPFQCIDMGAIAAQNQLARQNAVNLDLWDDEFGQWRWFPLDNMQVHLAVPSGAAKWDLRNLQVGIDRSIIFRDPELASTEFCSWEDQRPAFQPVNFSDYPLLASRIIAFGFRFRTEAIQDAQVLRRLESGQQPYTPIICAALPGSGT